MTKKLDTTSSKNLASGTKTFGDPDLFKCMSKAWNKEEEWMKSTKVMEIAGHGCVVQVSTQQGDNVAEALCFVPGVFFDEDMKALIPFDFNTEVANDFDELEESEEIEEVPMDKSDLRFEKESYGEHATYSSYLGDILLSRHFVLDTHDNNPIRLIDELKSFFISTKLALNSYGIDGSNDTHILETFNKDLLL